MAKIYTLSGSERLKQRKLIDALFKEGRKFAAFPVRVHYLFLPHHDQPLQAGFTASKKQFKKAWQRNTIKRKLREAYRLQKLPLQALLKEKNKHLILFIVYNGSTMPSYPLLEEKIGYLLKKLMVEVVNHETDSANS